MMDAEPALLSDGEATEAVQPGKAAFDHPAMAAEFLAGLRIPMIAAIDSD